MKKILTLLIAITLSGCYGHSVLNAASAYIQDGTNQNKKQLISAIDNTNDSFILQFTEDDSESIKKSLKTAIGRKDYDYSELLINRINNSMGIKFNAEDVVNETINFEQLEQDPTFKNAYFINQAGIYYAKKYHFKTAYYYFVKAADINNNYVDYVKVLLTHFGCKQNVLVWSGLVGGNIDQYGTPGLHLPGDQYPDLPQDKDFDLARSRMVLLEHHAIPELQNKCPINLYD
jgi:hypothetical protein